MQRLKHRRPDVRSGGSTKTLPGPRAISVQLARALELVYAQRRIELEQLFAS